MSCNKNCKICSRLIVSTAVAYDATENTLNITLPETGVSYINGCRVCIVVAQAIPETTTINALVNIVIGGSSFPLVKCNCLQATACEIQTRTKYQTKVVTDTVSGSFRLLTPLTCTRPSSLSALPITPTTTDGGGA